MDDVSVTVLGSSGAWPIPRPGCACPQCDRARRDPAERRTRSALRVGTAAGCVLVDAPPDVTAQLGREGVGPRVDRLVLTHPHHDHVLGLDDLVHVRETGDGPLPVHCGPATRRRVEAVFPNLLRAGRERIAFHAWHAGARLELGPVVLEGFETHHREEFATTAVLLGLRRAGGDVRIAYATDMGHAEPTPRAALDGVDLFVGDGTYLGVPGHGHPGTDRVVEIARALGARRLALTHVGHWQVDPDAARRALPEGVAICRDGEDLTALL